MKIAIVGCGLNSDYHIRFAKAYPGIEILGVVDRDSAKAAECAARQGIARHFSSVKELLASCKPDVVHIITPPNTHFAVAKEVIEGGCNLIIEKPLALNYEEAKELYELAEKKGVKLSAMHNHFFDPCMLKARELVESGKAGRIINVESFYGLNTRIDAFRKYPAPGVLPWLYSMPGGVYHDFMPHALYVMLPFLGRCEEMHLEEKSFGELPQNISDELRVMVKGEKAFGMLTFSFAAKPFHHFVRIYGTKMMIFVNFDTMTMTCHPVSGLPKAAQKATYNLSESLQLFKSTVSNVWNFGRGKLKPYQGMMILIHRFYDAVAGKGPVPVPKEEALSVIEMMDRMWPRIKNRYLKFENYIPEKQNSGPRVLITGATGFLGTRLAEKLLSRGYRVRALARKLSNVDRLKKLGAEVFYGDVAGIDSLKEAFAGVDFAIHAAADTAGRKDESESSSILGTRNMAEVCRKRNVKLVYISSCSVYGVADYRSGQVVDEESSLERLPEARGFYSYGKLKAEEIVTAAMKDGLKAVVLRPGTFFGPGTEVYTPMMGFKAGSIFAIIGNGKFVLPLIYIDNLIDAVIISMEKDAALGRVYNVVDHDAPTKREYVNRFLKKIYPGSRFFYMPYSAFYSLVLFQEILTKLMGRRPFLTRYRINSSQRPIIYSSRRIMDELGWKPPHTMTQAMEATLSYEQGRSE